MLRTTGAGGFDALNASDFHASGIAYQRFPVITKVFVYSTRTWEPAGEEIVRLADTCPTRIPGGLCQTERSRGSDAPARSPGIDKGRTFDASRG